MVPPGSSSDALVLNVDFAQTFLELAGVNAHPRMQGHSLVPLLRGEDPESVGWRTETYYRYWEHLDGIHHVAAHRGIRTKDRKLVHYYGSGCGQLGASSREIPAEWELFDLERDPEELRSVYDDPAFADDVRRLTEALDRLATELGDDIPAPTSPHPSEPEETS
jgi:arylsulfatase A-like enzyme